MRSLTDVVEALEGIAPLGLAAEWDNVGLLIEPLKRREAARLLLAIDLTEPVLEEALSLGVDLVVAYHPPLFTGLKRLTRATPAERVVLEAVAHAIAVYSPHTALDAAPGGINDWLLEGLGDVSRVTPIEPNAAQPAAGHGRVALLPERPTLGAVLERVKQHLGLAHVRVASPGPLDSVEIGRVAVCAGSGGSLFAAVTDADLFFTGEMRHHDVLAKVASGQAVVLTDHTHTERGYLPRLAERLRATLGGLEVYVSDADRDPLIIS